MSHHCPEDLFNLFNQFEWDVERTTSYESLYQRWERQHWCVTDLDFSADREQWLAGSDAQRKKWFAIGRFGGFYIGENRLAEALATWMNALPDQAQRTYLATQIADEARHGAFYGRFYQEVLGHAPEAMNDPEMTPRLGPAWHRIFEEALPRSESLIRAEPTNLRTLVAGVTLSHLIIENCLAMAGTRTTLRNFTNLDMFPCFRAGLTAVIRDESRHIQFGVCFLRDMIRKDRSLGETVISTIQAILLHVRDALAPPPAHIPVQLANGIDPYERITYAVNALARRLFAIGLTMELPEPKAWAEAA